MENYIPYFIEQQLKKENYSGNFKGTSLFMDISGFTPMTESLMNKGKEGAEILSGIINNVFEPIIKIIYNHGGFIAVFAGDAFTAIFENDMGSKSGTAALHIQEYFIKHGNQNTKYGNYNLKVKIGLSYGDINWIILGTRSHKTYLFHGPAVFGSGESEKHCSVEKIVLDNNLKQIFSTAKVKKTPAKDYYLLESCSPEHTPFVYEKKHRDPDILSLFVDKKILNENTKAEFRELCSVFISFKEFPSSEEFNNFIHFVLEKTNSFGGFFSSLDFGDKGYTILAFFGAPVSYENNPLRGINFAHSLLEVYTDKIKIGVTLGTAYTGFIGSDLRLYYTGQGNVINFSARLMSFAKWGQLILDPKTLSNINRYYNAISLGGQTLKGKTEKMELFSLTDKIHFIDSGLHSQKIIGRNEEVQKINNFLNPIYENKFAGFLSLYGEAGSGKSRILFEVTKLVQEKAQIFVLQVDGILKKSMNPLIFFVKDFFSIPSNISSEQAKILFLHSLNELSEKVKNSAHASEKTIHQIDNLHRTKSMIAAMLGIYWKNSLYERLDAKSRFDNTLIALKNFIQLISLNKALCLIIEDAHGIDKDSSDFLNSLSINMDSYPIAILAACRIADDSTLPDTFQLEKKDSKDNNSLHKKIILKKLSDNNTVELIKSHLPLEPEKKLCDFILEKTERNPLFIEEMCKYLVSSNLLSENENKLQLSNEDTNIPSSVNSILVARLDRLAPEIKTAVQTASVLGREFSLEVWKKVIDNNNAEQILEIGIKEGIWNKISDESVYFFQSLLRDAAYEMMMKKSLRFLHRQVALAFTIIYPNTKSYSPDIAYHYKKAEQHDLAKFFFYKAAQYAAENYKNEKALDFYSELIEYAFDDNERVDIIIKKIHVLDITGEWDDAIDLLEKAENAFGGSSSNNKQAALSISLGKIHYNKGNYKEADVCLNGAIKKASISDNKKIQADAYMRLGRTKWSTGNYEQALSNLGEAQKINSEIENKTGLALCLYYTGVVYRDMSSHKKALEFYEKSRKQFESLNDKRTISYPVYDIAVLYQYQGRLDASAKMFLQLSELYRDIGYRSGESASLLNLGAIEIKKGEYEKALEYFNQSLEIAEEVNEKLAISYTLFSIATAHYKLKKYKLALEFFKKSLILMIEIGAKGYYGYVFSYVASTYARVSYPNTAIKTVYRHIKNMKDTGSDVEHGRSKLAIAMILNQSAKLKTISSTRLKAISEFYSLQISAEDFFINAIETARKENYVSTLIPALFEYAKSLVNKNELKQAGELLQEAATLAEKSGMQTDLKKIKKYQLKNKI